MRSIITILLSCLACIFLNFVTGCATTKTTQSLLSEAGFTAQPATTPQQIAHLKSLRAHRFTPVTRDGKKYFVYPDAANNRIFVGQAAQLEQYQKLRAGYNQREEDHLEPEALMVTDWSVWGGW